ETIRRELSGTVLSAILSGLFSVFSFMLLFYFSVPLALVATVLVVLLVGVTTYIGLAETGYRRQISKLDGRLSGWALQFLSGISKLRTTGAEDKAFALWARDYSQRTRLSYKLGLLNNNLSVFMGAYPLLTLMAIFAVIGFSIRSDLSTGSFLAFNAAFSQFLNSVLGLSGAVVGALRVVPLYERAQPILEAVPETDPTRVEPGTLSGSIEVGHISFKYQDDLPLVLDDVSLRIQTGQFIALVGPSGSGKSTLFRLLMGFETPTAGAIYYGNLSLTTLNLHSVRQQLGVVLQNGKLMPGDILTNIIGVSNLTTDDAWEAARMAGLAEDIEAMPMGMHTVVGMGGTTFSGGQKQRLLIARAIVRKPRILFFDEATSALDNQTQDVVRSSLDSLATTRVVIAHRLSTIVNADHIYVLQRGQLVQQGTYEELIVQEGLFATLVKRQLT
ncbi:MAG: ATP-binding cassette domain-containing protein, partial [Gammaproteobacteria bacterium]|nr:ATP-binding cassette domain-containing protein [Gammaproteobacteria bacterium]